MRSVRRPRVRAAGGKRATKSDRLIHLAVGQCCLGGLAVWGVCPISGRRDAIESVTCCYLWGKFTPLGCVSRSAETASDPIITHAAAEWLGELRQPDGKALAGCELRKARRVVTDGWGVRGERGTRLRGDRRVGDDPRGIAAAHYGVRRELSVHGWIPGRPWLAPGWRGGANPLAPLLDHCKQFPGFPRRLLRGAIHLTRKITDPSGMRGCAIEVAPNDGRARSLIHDPRQGVEAEPVDGTKPGIRHEGSQPRSASGGSRHHLKEHIARCHPNQSRK